MTVSGSNVGIGTTNPATRLDITQASFAADAALRFNNPNHNEHWDMAISDNSGTILELSNYNSGTTVKWDNSGAMRLPLQPAFLVSPSSLQSDMSTGTEVTVIYGTEIFDQGGDFASNTFTAPVAGRYQLNAAIRVVALDSAAAYYLMKIVTSNRGYANILIDPDFGQDAAYWNFHNSVLADMDAGDTAYITLQQSGGTQQTDIDSGDSDTHFSGYLAC